MNNPELLVVFDLRDAGFKSWWFPASGLIFVAIGLALVRFPRRAMELFNQTKRPKFYKIFSRVFFGFAVLWTVVTFAATFGSYLSLRSDYNSGNFETVEGRVEDFRPMPSTGHKQESFTVQGQRFSYSDYDVTPGFNNTRSHGGPIGPGVYVRIRHVHGTIVRLDVERVAVEEAATRPAKSIWPSRNQVRTPPAGSRADILFRNFWVFQLIFFVFIAAMWRWRGRPHIARDPSLRAGYNRMALGFAIWANIPVILSGVGSTLHLAGNDDLLIANPDSWSRWTILQAAVFGLVIGKWVYWTYFQNGAAKLVRHPGICDHEWVAKTWPTLFAIGYVNLVVRSFFLG